MLCPYCTSDHIVPNSVLDGEVNRHCQNCGEDFMSEYDGYPEEDECEIVGHDWQEVDCGEGESYSECTRCGLIDD